MELDSYPTIGDITSYFGGGFTVQFGVNIEEDMVMIDYLIDQKWVDQQTRAVFFEFVVYNPTSNTHIISHCMVEFPPTGGMYR